MNPASVQETAAAVEKCIRAELIDLGVEEDSITPDAKFDELDIDSLDLSDLMATVQKEFKVNVLRSELADLTLGQFIERVAASVPR
jgi:acyl carrier protein